MWQTASRNLIVCGLDTDQACGIPGEIFAMDDEFTHEPIGTENTFFYPEKKNFLLLSTVAEVTLEAGRMLMEAGGSARSVKGIVQMMAHGLGADRVELRVGYASLAINIGMDETDVTRLCGVGEVGVNQRLILELWNLGKQVTSGELLAEQTRIALTQLARDTPRHAVWVTARPRGQPAQLSGAYWEWIGMALARSFSRQASDNSSGENCSGVM